MMMPILEDMRSGCDVTRNSFSVRPQMAGKANPRLEQSWAVEARDGGDIRWCGGAFPDLSALLSCCGPVHLLRRLWRHV